MAHQQLDGRYRPNLKCRALGRGEVPSEGEHVYANQHTTDHYSVQQRTRANFRNHTKRELFKENVKDCPDMQGYKVPPPAHGESWTITSNATPSRDVLCGPRAPGRLAAPADFRLRDRLNSGATVQGTPSNQFRRSEPLSSLGPDHASLGRAVNARKRLAGQKSFQPLQTVRADSLTPAHVKERQRKRFVPDGAQVVQQTPEDTLGRELVASAKKRAQPGAVHQTQSVPHILS